WISRTAISAVSTAPPPRCLAVPALPLHLELEAAFGAMRIDRDDMPIDPIAPGRQRRQRQYQRRRVLRIDRGPAGRDGPARDGCQRDPGKQRLDRLAESEPQG